MGPATNKLDNLDRKRSKSEMKNGRATAGGGLGSRSPQFATNTLAGAC